MMLSWDVLNGVCDTGTHTLASTHSHSHTQLSRRSWSGHPLAKETICAAMATQPKLKITIPHEVQSCDLLDQVIQN